MKIKMALTFVFLFLLAGCGQGKKYITKEECAQQCVDVCVESIQIVSPLLESR